MLVWNEIYKFGRSGRIKNQKFKGSVSRVAMTPKRPAFDTLSGLEPTSQFGR